MGDEHDHEPAPEPVLLPVRADLARLFQRACEQLGRDTDDVLSDMLQRFLREKNIATIVDSDRPLSPPPGPCEDPTQPHAHPFCHNAHTQIRDRRVVKNLARVERQLTPGEARDQVDEARDKRRARARALALERASRR
jgi:hypothetical protein